MLLIGVDEAGYGPLLGPLVVAGAAFRLSEPDPERPLADFAGRLAEAVADVAGVAVGDSKQIHGRGGLAALERGVLAFLAVTDWAGVIDAVGVDDAERSAVPWYAGTPDPFPHRIEPAALIDRAQALREALSSRGIAFLGCAADCQPEDRLNDGFDRTGNKSDLLFEVSADVADRLLARRGPAEPVELVFDRQGGRKHYLPHIQTRWPESWGWTLEESKSRSLYRLDGAGGPVSVRFVVGGDDLHPQVGLASMLAKYLRETYMALWNDWFGALCPDVRPTAGYTEDGRRWLDDTRAAREAADLPDARLVRRR